MNEEWDKLWKDLQFKWTQPEEWEKQVKVLGDKLRERVEYLEGLTDGDVKLITKLQEELNLYKLKYKGMYEINQFNIGEADKDHEKLKAIRGVVAEYPKCDKNGLAFEWDELITRILAVLDGSAQNTDYVQKEEAT